MIFQNILTTIGQQKRAIAETGGVSLNITHFKIGDSDGQYYEPAEAQIDLVNTKYTANFTGQSQILVNPTSSNEVLYKCFVPAEIGGFTIRELGLFDSNNDLILICKLPAQDKFALDSGLYQPLTFTPKIIFTNPQTQAVLTVSSQILATHEFVENLPHYTAPDAHKSLFDEMKEIIPNYIGSFVNGSYATSFIPEGCLPTNGVEYDGATQFKNFYNNYLTSDPSKLQTCTYAEYASEILEHGYCEKFAVDTENSKFKVPTKNKFRKLHKSVTNGAYRYDLYDDGWVEYYCYGTSPTTINLPFIFSSNNFICEITSKTFESQQAKPTAKTTSSITVSSIEWNGTVGSRAVNFDLIAFGYTTPPNIESTREFVVIANGQVNQSIMDWSAWAIGLNVKADKDLNNITLEGENRIKNIVPLSKLWTSVEYASSGVQTVSVPTEIDINKCIVQVLLKCAVAQGNYSVGDLAPYNWSSGSDSNWNGANIDLTNRTIQATGGNTLFIPCKNTTGYFGGSSANWRFVFRILY